MVCPVCGRESEVGLFCSDCYMKQNLRIEVPPTVELTGCKTCGSFFIKGKWVKDPSEEEAALGAVRESIRTNIKRLDKAGVLEAKVEKAGKGYDGTVTIKLAGSERRLKTRVKVRRVACPDCSRIAGGYYEAVLQLRGEAGKDILEDILGRVEKHKDRFSFVVNVKKVRGGYDVYLGSKKSAEKIVRQFRGKAEIKKSFEHVGLDRQSGKKRRRFYYLIRL